MNDLVTVTMDKELARTVETIKALRDCGIICVTDELTCMDGIWDRLTAEDKRLISGMIRGAAVMLTHEGGQI